VTGVCSTTKVDFTDGVQQYHAIVDTAGNRSLSQLRRALVSTGIIVIVGGEGGNRWTGGFGRQILRAPVLSMLGSQKMRAVLPKESGDDLIVLKGLIETGKLTPILDRIYQLVEVTEAVQYLARGHGRGKVVIRV
jgi:NADPH:quinone reductase-like Zn-dependent oxidoreductase